MVYFRYIQRGDDVVKKINGTQSTVYIDMRNQIVKKVATLRGRQEVLDQIEFYNSLELPVKSYFPEIIEYSSIEDPPFFSYKLINGDCLRDVLLNDMFDVRWANRLARVINQIHKDIHSIHICAPREEELKNIYSDRLNNRVVEAARLSSITNLYSVDIVYQDKLFSSPIKGIEDIVNANFDSLIPEYICSTHGQLGPSHIFIKPDSDKFCLIDPKGFGKLYDPVIDICKIGKAMVFATEWFEENKFSIDYSFSEKSLVINDFEVFDYSRKRMSTLFFSMCNNIDFINSCKNGIQRLIAMMCVDLIGGLPYAYVAQGEKRMAAILLQIAFAHRLLSDSFDNDFSWK